MRSATASTRLALSRPSTRSWSASRERCASRSSSAKALKSASSSPCSRPKWLSAHAATVGLRRAPISFARAASPALRACPASWARSVVNSPGLAAYSCSTAARRWRITSASSRTRAAGGVVQGGAGGHSGAVIWICETCAVETADLPQPPSECRVCEDERQWVPADGQRWTSLGELRARGTRIVSSEVEPDLWGLRAEPAVGIGQQTMVVRTPSGTLLFDCVGYVDDEALELVRSL